MAQPRVFEIDPNTAQDLDEIRRKLKMEDNAGVILRAIELIKVALKYSNTDRVVIILTPDGKTLPVRLSGP
jgi:hypothetical protein